LADGTHLPKHSTGRVWNPVRAYVETGAPIGAVAVLANDSSIFELLYRRFVVRVGHAQAIGVIAHRLCRLVWKILHDGVTYEERGPAVHKARAHRRAAKMIRQLRSLGYCVEPVPAPSSNRA
jgi:hypothetical protein